MSDEAAEGDLRCTFCSKPAKEVVALLAFPGVLSICDECVSLMVGIIAADHPDWRSAQIEKLERLATPARG
jgi:ATP-dependent protease Clp ATPase subunit